MVYDFDVMLSKKKEEMGSRRKRKKDSEMINDNDDLIVDIINKMKTAAEVSKTYYVFHFGDRIRITMMFKSDQTLWFIVINLYKK